MAVQFGGEGLSRPAPRWWRNFERGMLLLIIPAATAIVQGWGFADQTLALKINLGVNTGLVAIIKFIGMCIFDTGDNYVSNLTEHDKNKVDVNPPKPNI